MAASAGFMKIGAYKTIKYCCVCHRKFFVNRSSNRNYCEDCCKEKPDQQDAF